MSDIKYVLSLDGGGIKGTYIAHIIDAVSKLLGAPIQSKLDMLFGTSVGGLIALKLAQLDRDQAFDCQTLFDSKNAGMIFDKGIMDKTLGLFQWRPVYDGKGKTSVIASVLDDQSIAETTTPVGVVAYKLGDFTPHVFCSWDSKESIRLCADATSAAPVYFPAIKSGADWYVDGGIGINNPVVMAIMCARKMFPSSRIKVLSIGSGSWFPKHDDANISQWGLSDWVKHGMIDMLMSASSQANDDVARHMLGSDFVRLNHRKLIDVRTDDCDEATMKTLIQYASETIEKKKETILNLFKP